MIDPTILDLLPHRPPFLFVERVVGADERRMVAELTVDPAAPFFAGHFPGRPVMPGVLLCEAAFQAGAMLMARLLRREEGHTGGTGAALPVVTRISDARFKHMVRPGEVLTIEVTLDEALDNAYYMTGRVSAGGRPALRVSFACMAVEAEGGA